MKKTTTRRLPVGAEVQPEGGVHFRVWAPRRERVDVVIESNIFPLAREAAGYFSGLVPDASSGALYRYRLDEGESFPDPASRFQPEGPHGPSQVVDPAGYRWGDTAWRGHPLEGLVIYELHVGTFTREGTLKAAARELRALASLGISMVEIMPLADFAGRFGWGYDGVDLFAPTRLYGTPDDLRAFVDEAHAAGIAVILDVVYNHLGPDGNYVREYAEEYFSHHYDNEWGDALNFDGPGSAPVREFFVSNARYWIDEFHMDGLRLDATQQIFDRSPSHILQEVSVAAREAAGARAIFIVAENETQDRQLVCPGGYGLDALWNDDFHHSARVALTGWRDAYYTDYHGAAQELLSAVKHGFLYQGQRYKWQRKRRGTPTLDLAPTAFVNFIENHDQVANSPRGLRLHQLTSPARHRAMTALLLLAPQTPMLFQGQEFASSAPFLFFADHEPELAAAVRKGRVEFMSQFASIDLARLDDPCDEETFRRCVLDFSERDRNAEVYALTRDLLRLRRDDAAFRMQRKDALDGAVLAQEAFVLRYTCAAGDRLLAVNLGPDLAFYPSPEPLLAPPEGASWELLWSSEDPRYGGAGTAPLETGEGWRLPGNAAVVLAPNPSTDRTS